ncbi:myosin-16 isoform X3 [Strongylocentrotus purpuratus]|uniref:Myosin heavy chain n=1 Tax=Strongylocentrotus purpuratus TaxID=7668 RepID=A0A7M7HQF5_STRPU|nr:myosin-16 isoform X3 [Strongylocentrotus purpuratus]|eukprot:XP_011682897.1 PREDICTED: myosin heavy chain, striated muscle isoform X3 [Strongylocentrotus purpuratus]
MADESDQYLQVGKKAQLESQAQSFDGKKMCWINDDKQGYIKCEILSTKGEECTVKTATGKQVTVKKDDTQQMNPPKFEKIEDMAGMTYLNEASVLENLRQRYYSGLIYTYSGLFCVAINPYRRLPIYTDKVVMLYKGKRRTEMPPHVYSIADNAYHDMLQNHENQSMLITGESGAGKTENTKKVIQYFANIASVSTGGKLQQDTPEGGKKGNLEDQVIQTNPPLEAFGNAKTIRNDNSSRFGKFIRIHFGTSGKLAGADIETYLLEKSRVIRQNGVERSYHIFYQICSGYRQDVLDTLLLEKGCKTYCFQNQGEVEIDGVDDVEEFKLTDDALDVLGFSFEEKMSMYKMCATIMHFGNVEWKQRPREEQAEIESTTIIDKVAFLFGINPQELVKNLLKPRIKVGNEYVSQGRTKAQVVYSVGALAKAIYNRLFSWLVQRVNKTLATKATKAFFIGVLDIAGFEIFDFNTFEQICINLTNEKLQQFFNHHMFVLEQEEYKREGINWVFIDFGLDLQDTITLIEGQMGVFAMLEEECMFPKATDFTFLEKLLKQHANNAKITKPSVGGKNVKKHAVHFEIHHYAGTVDYNVESWLDKNKDPLNEAVVELFRKSTDELLATIFTDAAAAAGRGRGKGKEKKIKTISAGHREQLTRLLATLYNTQPHFVRCIIPNEKKAPGVIDAFLVLHQLACNGVLEGIRICRKGFPNRLPFGEFKQRYAILAPSAIPQGFLDSRKASDMLLKALPLEENEFRMGHTKVFFRAGVLGKLEEWRDDRLAEIISMIQAQIRGYLGRIEFKKMLDQKLGLGVIQRNLRKYLILRNWGWWRLYTKVKPLLNVARAEDEMKAKDDVIKKAKELLKKEGDARKAMEEKNADLLKEKADLLAQLNSEAESSAEIEEKFTKMMSLKADLQTQLTDLQDRLEEEEDAGASASAARRKLEQESSELKRDIEDLEISLTKSEEEKKQKDAAIRSLNDDIAAQDEVIGKLSKEKANLEEEHNKTLDALAQEEEKANHLSKVKAKLEASVDELEDGLEHEKKIRADVEKVKRKLEGDLKMTQETVEELEHAKREAEESIKKRDFEVSQLNTRLEDEQSLVAQLQRKIKELQARIEELEEELEAERQNRAKAEKQRADVTRELEDLGDRLEEQGGATAAQIEVNKRREAELSKLKREIEDQIVQHESVASQLRKKHTDSVAELTENLESVNRNKSKMEKERTQLRVELEDVSSNMDYITKAKLNAEKSCHQLESQLSEANAALNERDRAINDLQNSKSRLGSENSDLARQLEDLENQLSQLNKTRMSLSMQMEEYKRSSDEESRAKNSLASQLRQLQADNDQLRDQVEEESEARAEVQRILTKVNGELNQMRAKFDGEAVQRAEELEEAKRKLMIRLAQVEEELSSALSKNGSLEKTKARLTGEVEDLQLDLERSNQLCATLEKKQRNFDKDLAVWKEKCESLAVELDMSQREARTYSTELFKVKNSYEESLEVIVNVRRDNKSLQDEIQDLTDQLGEGGKNCHELQKLVKRLELEKDELRVALEEAEAHLEAEEAKVIRAQLEITQVKQECDRRIIEKDEEFEITRKNHERSMESMQASLEAELKAKSDAQRLKKKLEGEVNDLEIQLDHANRNSAEAIKTIKKLQMQVKELQATVDEETRAREDMRDQLQITERRSMMLIQELEEVRSALETTERLRKLAEGDLQDANDRLAEVSAQNHVLSNQRRKAEAELQTLTAELEDAINEARNNDDNAKKAIADATRLADELRTEQEHSVQIEKFRKSLEVQIKDMQVRLDEAEAAALKGGRRTIEKLEARLRDLEGELEMEARRRSDAEKAVRRQERRVKEIIFQSEEDRKITERIQESCDKLTIKCKTLKRQLEESEENVNQNLAKYRNAQRDLEDYEERVELAETQVNKYRAKQRSQVTTSTRVSSGGYSPYSSFRRVSRSSSVLSAFSARGDVSTPSLRGDSNHEINHQAKKE